MSDGRLFDLDTFDAAPDTPGTPPAPEPELARFPDDQAHRDRISRDLDATLFVEAGAGSGK